MKILTSILTILFLSFANVQAFAAQPVYLNNNNTVIMENGVLKGVISTTKDLPGGFYGKWSVKSKMLESTAPYMFKEEGVDIWKFEKINGLITLTNPSSGASASITVNEVEGFTARFTRTKVTGNIKEYESPIVTLNGDSFSGTDTLIFEYYSSGILIRKDVVKYAITGKKISGSSLNNIFLNN